MGLLTNEERESDYEELLQFFLDVGIKAERIGMEQGLEAEGIYVWEPKEEDESEEEEDISTFIQMIQMEEEEDQIGKGAFIYMELRLGENTVSEDGLFRTCAILNTHTGIGSFYPAQTENGTVIRYRYIHMTEQGEPLNVGVFTEILLNMFTYMSYARSSILLAFSEEKDEN